MANIDMCHPTGMLDRDQRTAMTTANIEKFKQINHPYYTNLNVNYNHNYRHQKNHHQISLKSSTSSSSSSTQVHHSEICDNNLSSCTLSGNNKDISVVKRRNMKSLRVPKISQKVTDFLLISLYIWLLTGQSASSYPTPGDMDSMDSVPGKLDSFQQWKAGCQGNGKDSQAPTNDDVKLTLRAILKSCQEALNNAQNRVDKYNSGLSALGGSNNTTDISVYKTIYDNMGQGYVEMENCTDPAKRFSNFSMNLKYNKLLRIHVIRHGYIDRPLKNNTKECRVKCSLEYTNDSSTNGTMVKLTEIEAMWGVSFRNHHQMWRKTNESFYYGKDEKKIKDLGDKLPDNFIEEIENIDFNDNKNLARFLFKMYARFYRINMGIDVVKNDTKKEADRREWHINQLLDEIFTKISVNLETVLCEVYSGIRDLTDQEFVENNVKEFENDDGKEVALVNNTSTLRDWLVYREYITQLEVAVGALDIMYKKAADISK